MDHRGKKISVNASSLVDLKAELFRKQEEFKQQKLLSSTSFAKPTPSIKKTTIWSKTNSGVLHRAQNDLTEKTEERDVLDQSKSALEAKALLYEKMTKGDVLPEEDGSILYLVDFQQKALEVISDQRREQRNAEEKERNRVEEEEEKKLLSEKIVPSDNAEEEWVDYVDSFGRSRKCLKKDLQYLTEKDRKMSGKSVSSLSMADGNLELMSADMKRELQRQAWERETEESMKGPVGPTHYANVQRNEVREHGVGYFQFAKDEETRQQQLDELNKLRNQTTEERDKRQKIKDKRDALLQARLNKVRQRKTVQDAADIVDLDPMSMLENRKNGEDGTIDPPVPVQIESAPIKVPEPIVRDESFRKNAPVREWDRGKKPVIYDERTWLDSRRDERPSQFAPPVAVYETMSKTRRQEAASTGGCTISPPSVKHGDKRNLHHSEKGNNTNNVEQWVGAGIKSLRTEHQNKQQNKINLDNIRRESSDLSAIELPRQHFCNAMNDKEPLFDRAISNPEQYDALQHQYQNISDYNTNFDSVAQYNVAGCVKTEMNAINGSTYYSSSARSNVQSTESSPTTNDLWTSSYDGTENNYCPPGYQSAINTEHLSGCHGTINNESIPVYHGTIDSKYIMPGYHGTDNNESMSGYHGTINNELLPDNLKKTVHYFQHPEDEFQSYQNNPSEGMHDITQQPHTDTSLNIVTHSQVVINDNTGTSTFGNWLMENNAEGNKLDSMMSAEPPKLSEPIKAPQPAHFSSVPTKPQPKKAKYEAIYLHELPPCLPAPPSSESVPHYPSQEEVIGPSRRNDQPRVISEGTAIKNWYKQFDNNSLRTISTNRLSTNDSRDMPDAAINSSKPIHLKPKNIPFASPYIQSERVAEKSAKELAAAEYDPSKPPPPVTSQN